MSSEITSLRNPIVQSAKRLHRRGDRQSQRRFLVEGTHLLREALATKWPLVSIFYTDSWVTKHAQLLPKFGSKVSLYRVSTSVIERIATTVQPDGVVAIAEMPTFNPSPPTQLRLGIFVENLQNPDNLGSLIRCSAAAGADGLWIDNASVDSTNPKVLRSSAGQWFRLTPRIAKDVATLRESCSDGKLQILGAAAEGKCLWEIDFTKPTVVVLGNEGNGLSPQARSQVDGLVSVPMAAEVESLNVAMTGALLLYEAARQRRRPIDPVKK